MACALSAHGRGRIGGRRGAAVVGGGGGGGRVHYPPTAGAGSEPVGVVGMAAEFPAAGHHAASGSALHASLGRPTLEQSQHPWRRPDPPPVTAAPIRRARSAIGFVGILHGYPRRRPCNEDTAWGRHSPDRQTA